MSTNSLSFRAWLEVDLGNLVSNARTVLQAARGARLLPMVKADGYGLGAVRVALALEAVDPWGFGVATIDEGIELREAGVSRPILVFTPATVDFLNPFRQHDLTAVLDTLESISVWDAPFHLEIDTGMGRTGVTWDDTALLMKVRSRYMQGAFTHFHSADERPETVPHQLSRFQEALGALPSRPEFVHAANSTGVWVASETLDLVRPGIFLYGGSIADHVPEPRSVVSLRAPIVSLREISRGDSVSYGAAWKAQSDTVVATLGAGFADGVPRSLFGQGQVIVAGTRCPIVGRVTMDLTMIDVGSLAPGSVRVGSTATLLGAAGEDEISLAEFAGWAVTNTYEVLVRLNSRAERRYLPDLSKAQA